jgi:hypothetical protein
MTTERRLAGGFRKFEFDRPASFLLSDACAVDCIAAWRDVVEIQGHYVPFAALHELWPV